MPYSRAAINPKNKCPERGQRILARALICPAPSPGKDHSLGRWRDGTALTACCRRPGGPKPITVTARSTPIGGTERRRFFAVGGTLPIISPVDAERAGIVQESRVLK
jgi:hypothetical protein